MCVIHFYPFVFCLVVKFNWHLHMACSNILVHFGVICSGRRQGGLLFKIMGYGIERGIWQTLWSRQGPPLSAPHSKVQIAF